jgi:hypothetical protein
MLASVRIHSAYPSPLCFSRRLRCRPLRSFFRLGGLRPGLGRLRVSFKLGRARAFHAGGSAPTASSIGSLKVALTAEAGPVLPYIGAGRLRQPACHCQCRWRPGSEGPGAHRAFGPAACGAAVPTGTRAVRRRVHARDGRPVPGPRPAPGLARAASDSWLVGRSGPSHPQAAVPLAVPGPVGLEIMTQSLRRSAGSRSVRRSGSLRAATCAARQVRRQSEQPSMQQGPFDYK